MLLPKILLVCVALKCISADSTFKDDRDLHPHKTNFVQSRFGEQDKFGEAEKTTRFWSSKAQTSLRHKLLHPSYNTGIAKNVILFLGDGMSIPTVTAARIYMGQLNKERGENSQLSFEKFPHVGLSKTYCVDSQVPDSACTSTAYLGGVKGNFGTIGVTAAVPLGECAPSKNKSTHVDSIARWSQLRNKRTGFVTTARVTHASPTGVYGSTADRNWECDADVAKDGVSAKDCPDIAQQLIYGETGRYLNVIMGGGRQKMLPNNVKDEEGKMGQRLDGKNLINEWKAGKRSKNAKYVWNRNDLINLPRNTDYVLGLFESSHMSYHLEADPTTEPTLAEMVDSAIRVLNKGDEGFFLFVEGAEIDIAHHETLAKKALDETVEFSKAVQRAADMTSPEDTLIVVTSDHAHTMSLVGYPSRGSDILGKADDALDRLPYSTLSYANGPGYRAETNGKRYDLRKDDTRDNNYLFPSMVPLTAETHGGDDVAIFAHGPWAHLFSGVNEQNVIPHIMAFASCVGDGITVCDEDDVDGKPNHYDNRYVWTN